MQRNEKTITVHRKGEYFYEAQSNCVQGQVKAHATTPAQAVIKYVAANKISGRDFIVIFAK